MNKKLDTAIHVITFINILFIGSDIFSFEIIGVTVRYIQIGLLLGFLLLAIKRKRNIKIPKILILYLLIMFITSILAVNIKLGIIYYLSIIYNSIFVFLYFKEYIREYKINNFTKLFRLSCYGIAVLMIIVFGLEKFGIEILSYGYYLGVYRINLWFYEPSYLSTYLSIWYSLALYYLIVKGDKGYIKDIVFSILSFILSTATTGFIAIIVSFGFVVLMVIRKLKVKHYLIMGLTLIATILLVLLVFPNVFDVFFLRLFEGISQASGDRIKRYSETVNVFLENPIFGIGTGCYGYYLNQAGLVPTNVLLEMLASLGIVGTTMFLYFIFMPVVKAYKSNNIDYKAYSYSLIIFFIILQANQNYLRLYMFMIMGVVYGLYEEGSDFDGKCSNPGLQLF